MASVCVAALFNMSNHLLFFRLISRVLIVFIFFFFQAEDGIRDLVRSRGLGDVYKRQASDRNHRTFPGSPGSFCPSFHDRAPIPTTVLLLTLSLIHI